MVGVQRPIYDRSQFCDFEINACKLLASSEFPGGVRRCEMHALELRISQPGISERPFQPTPTPAPAPQLSAQEQELFDHLDMGANAEAEQMPFWCEHPGCAELQAVACRRGDGSISRLCARHARWLVLEARARGGRVRVVDSAADSVDRMLSGASR